MVNGGETVNGVRLVVCKIINVYCILWCSTMVLFHEREREYSLLVYMSAIHSR